MENEEFTLKELIRFSKQIWSICNWAVDTTDLWSRMMRMSSAVWVETNPWSTNAATRDSSKAASCLFRLLCVGIASSSGLQLLLTRSVAPKLCTSHASMTCHILMSRVPSHRYCTPTDCASASPCISSAAHHGNVCHVQADCRKLASAEGCHSCVWRARSSELSWYEKCFNARYLADLAIRRRHRMWNSSNCATCQRCRTHDLLP